MKIHEYQAKAVLRKFGVPVPRGEAAFSVEEAENIARELGSDMVVVKAQIHAGGRGKGGGVKLADSVEEAKKLAGEILGMTLVTHQTGPEGKEVGRLLIEEGLDIAQELYLHRPGTLSRHPGGPRRLPPAGDAQRRRRHGDRKGGCRDPGTDHQGAR